MTDCIEHMGYKNKDGYGRVSYKGKATGAHRKAWILANGNIPVGMNVLHRCDNPACVKIEHLFLGSQLDNVKDMLSKGRNRKSTAIRKSDGKPSHAKLSTEQIVIAKQMLSQGVKQITIGNLLGVSQPCISAIKRGVTNYAI